MGAPPWKWSLSFFMRFSSILPAVALLAPLLAGCGMTQVETAQSLPMIQAATAQPTAAPTATPVPPTATPAPTATATPAPTATPEPPTATPEPPTATPEPTRITSGVAPSEPVRLQIPDIGLDYEPVAVGLNANNVPIVLDHDVAWYKHSAKPGEGENVVMWAHVLRFLAAPKIPAPFANVEKLAPGALILVTTANGETARYQITQQLRVLPNEVQVMLPSGKEQLTLISCIGDKVYTSGSVTKKERLVTIAEPVTE